MEELRSIVNLSRGAKEIIAVTNGGDEIIVEENLRKLAKDSFRRDEKVKVLAHPTYKDRGQFLAILDAVEHWEAIHGEFNQDEVALGVLMPGKGTRMSPFTQRMHGIKPFIELLIRSIKDSPWLSGATASLYSWNLVAYHLKRMGFRGIAWKWGDEPQIASNLMAGINIDLFNTDAVRFGSKITITDDLAENKEWLLVDPNNADLIMQVRRRPRSELLERFGIEDKGQIIKGYIHIGSPAFSYLFLQEAKEVFKDMPEAAIDVDGYLFESLIQDLDTWSKELSRDKGLQALVAEYPDFYERGQILKKRIERRRSRPLEIKVIDFGEKLYWADVGQLAKARDSMNDLLRDTERICPPNGLYKISS